MGKRVWRTPGKNKTADKMVVLDTSAVIELVKGSEKGAKIKDILEKEAAAVCAVTIN